VLGSTPRADWWPFTDATISPASFVEIRIAILMRRELGDGEHKAFTEKFSDSYLYLNNLCRLHRDKKFTLGFPSPCHMGG